jgi:hypothetical protein
MANRHPVLLRNGNPQGDPNSAPRCGAQNRDNTECGAPGMKNGRCRLHGGKSTGPRTLKGLENSKRGNWKHGLYAKDGVIDVEKLNATQLLNFYKKRVNHYNRELRNLAKLFGGIYQTIKKQTQDIDMEELKGQQNTSYGPVEVGNSYTELTDEWLEERKKIEEIIKNVYHTID